MAKFGSQKVPTISLVLSSIQRSAYIEALPPSGATKGTMLLIHGFPQTSYQFRRVIRPLADGELDICGVLAVSETACSTLRESYFLKED